jgi:hypothetical protein
MNPLRDQSRYRRLVLSRLEGMYIPPRNAQAHRCSSFIDVIEINCTFTAPLFEGTARSVTIIRSVLRIFSLPQTESDFTLNGLLTNPFIDGF